MQVRLYLQECPRRSRCLLGGQSPQHDPGAGPGIPVNLSCAVVVETCTSNDQLACRAPPPPPPPPGNCGRTQGKTHHHDQHPAWSDMPRDAGRWILPQELELLSLLTARVQSTFFGLAKLCKFPRECSGDALQVSSRMQCVLCAMSTCVHEP